MTDDTPDREAETMTDDQDTREVSATARCVVQLEVQLTQPWNGKETVKEVYRRAEREAKEEVARIVAKSNMSHRVLECKVTAVLCARERR